MPDLVEELPGRERDAGDAVQALGLAQLLLLCVLQRDQPAHQVLDVDHRQLRVRLDGAVVHPAARRSQQRVEGVLGRAVAPDGRAVEHAGQHCDAGVAVVFDPELVQQLAHPALLDAVVAAGVLRRVVDQPARRGVVARRGGAEGPDRVREADAPAADLLHRRERVLHAPNDNLLGQLRRQGRLHRERGREVPHVGLLVSVVPEELVERFRVADVHLAHELVRDRAHRRRHLLQPVCRDDLGPRLAQRGA